MSLDLPLIWAGLIALAVFMYVVMDGFDLGVGILFPFARNTADRDTMMNSVAPVWDGNETWLVLGGGGLFAAFPLAYSILMPALYLPVLIMLLALVLRGVAFEFRFQGRHHGRRLWSVLFCVGSITAALAQGFILGGFIQGVTVHADRFAGGPFDWCTPYTLLVAVGLVVGYALLGAAWLTLKTEHELHGDARKWAAFAAIGTGVLLAAVSTATLFVHPDVAARWGLKGMSLDWARFLPLSPIPLVGLVGLIIIALGLRAKSHWAPFLGAFLIYLSGYVGLAVGFAPHIVPYAVTYEQAAAPANAQMLMLVGALIALPLILGYTAWVYWVFRGKVADEGYHGS